MELRPEEFISAREASRRLGKLIDKLESGELAKAVIVNRNKPRAVLLSIEEYETRITTTSEESIRKVI